MKAISIIGSLKKSPAFSNTEELAQKVLGLLKDRGVQVESVRLSDLDIKHGSQTEMEDDFSNLLKKNSGLRNSYICNFNTLGTALFAHTKDSREVKPNR